MDPPYEPFPMPHFNRLALLLAFPLLAVAAPVPESVTHAKAFKKTFGTSHSPAEDCTFKFDGATLTAGLSKGWVGGQHHHKDCLHTERAITGDFEVTVTMRTTAPVEPPKGGGKGGKRCDLGGGLAVWEADAKDPNKVATDAQKREKVVSVCRYYNFEGEPGPGESRSWLKGNYANYPGMVYDGNAEGGDPTEVVHWRMSRRGNLLTSATSTDGEKWTEFSSQTVELADTVSVGVWAFNGTGTQYDVVFEKFTLTPLK